MIKTYCHVVSIQFHMFFGHNKTVCILNCDCCYYYEANLNSHFGKSVILSYFHNSYPSIFNIFGMRITHRWLLQKNFFQMDFHVLEGIFIFHYYTWWIAGPKWCLPNHLNTAGGLMHALHDIEPLFPFALKWVDAQQKSLSCQSFSMGKATNSSYKFFSQ